VGGQGWPEEIPAKHREALIAEAKREFALFEERILKPAE
jgi:hypothetical protein